MNNRSLARILKVLVLLAGALVVSAFDMRSPMPVFVYQDAGQSVSRAENGLFKWGVHITATGECGGVIIKQGWVLTAAHCVAEEVDYRSKVTVRLRGEPEGLLVPTRIMTCWDRIYIPEEYSHPPNVYPPYTEFDIALLQVEFPEMIPQSLAIERARTADETGLTSAYVAAWRSFKIPPVTRSRAALGYSKVDMRPQAQCEEKSGSVGAPSKRFICAGGQGEPPDMSVQDSGSGLTTQASGAAKLLGIASEAAGWVHYARMTSYESWIDETMAKNAGAKLRRNKCGT